MHGLRRITLCENKIGDKGARILADALKDDLWVKGISLGFSCFFLLINYLHLKLYGARRNIVFFKLCFIYFIFWITFETN